MMLNCFYILSGSTGKLPGPCGDRRVPLPGQHARPRPGGGVDAARTWRDAGVAGAAQVSQVLNVFLI